jgi:hypothetical protein
MDWPIGDVLAAVSIAVNVGVAFVALRIRADISDLKIWSLERFEPKDMRRSPVRSLRN